VPNKGLCLYFILHFIAIINRLKRLKEDF
jgi:hypothetical protein